MHPARFVRKYWFEIVSCIVAALVGLAVAWAAPDYDSGESDWPHPMEIRVWGVGD